jgi:V/A-type H+-transporting ATPase subunit I
VINTLASLAGSGLVERGGIYFILGYLIMIVIFVFGHAFNILLNIVGSYINVGRLHFVEFFSKFYESGGSELQPLAPSQEHIIVE